MNLPNKLTMLRVIMIPFFIVFLLVDALQPAGRYIALVIFIVASLTDMADGKIARKYHLVTNFGKFADPLADKLLVSSALVCFVELKLLPAWMVICIISREFIISGLREIAAANNIVIAASYWGKFKTTFQMIMVVLLLLQLPGTVFNVITELVKWIALALTIISMIDYLVKNAAVLKENK